MSLPVAGGFPSSDGVSIGNEVPGSNGHPGTQTPPVSGTHPVSTAPSHTAPPHTDGLHTDGPHTDGPHTDGPPASGGRALASPGLDTIDGLFARALPTDPTADLPWLTRVLSQAPTLNPAEIMRARLSDFRNDPRTPSRIKHTAGAAALGVVVTVLVGWQSGLALGLLIATAAALYRARISPVVPAALRAVSAKRRTRRRLSWLSPAGYLSLHARYLPGTDTVVEHLVVGPAGVYVLDSERWDRRLPVRASEGEQLFHGPYDQSGRIEQVRRVAARASTLISQALGQPVAVRPAMVIHGPRVPWTVVRVSEVDVLCGRRLRRYFRREKAANRGRCLSEGQILYLHAAACKLLHPVRGQAMAGPR